VRSGSRYIKIILTCVLSVIILISFSKFVHAAYYEMNVSVGFDNQAKYGRYVPIMVELYSEDDFEGMLSINTEFENGNRQTISYPVKIKAGEYSTVKTYYTLFVKDNSISFSLKDIFGEEIKHKDVELEVFEDDYTELFVGVLSENKQMIDLFNDINLGEYSDSTFPYIFTKSFEITSDNIWGDTLYTLDCLDIIIVTWDAASKLTKEKMQALSEWAASGKTLILEYDDLFSGEFQNIYKTAYSEKKESDELIPGFWIYSSDYNSGRIGVIVANSDERDFYAYTANNKTLLGLILGKSCTLNMVDEIINYDIYYANYDNSYAVEYMLSMMQGKKVPDIREYVIIITVYIILVGPVLYFILGWLKKLKYVLPCVLVLVTIFSVCIYVMSQNTRFTDIFLQYANIVDIKDERVDEVTYFSANVPYNKTYYLKFDSEYMIKPLLKMKAEEEGNYLEILYDDITKVILKKNISFDKEYFEAINTSTNINEWDIDVDISFFDGVLMGSIANNMDKNIENAALIIFDKMVLIGDIMSGEIKDITLSDMFTLPYYANDVAHMIAGDDLKDSGNVTKIKDGKVAVADYVISRYFEEKKTIPILIGGVDLAVGLVEDMEAYGYTMFCKEVNVDTAQGNFLYEPVGYDKIENKNNNTNYDSYSNTTYSSSVRLQYEFEDKDNISKIIFDNKVLSDGEKVYYGRFEGEVLFYNYITLEYDKIDIDRGYFDIEELMEYLIETEDGGYNLTAQYNIESDGKYRYTEIKMPFVSVIRRLDNAESTES